MRVFRAMLVGFLALMGTGCGDGSVQSPDFTSVLQELRIVPLAATVAAGRTVQFSAVGVYTLPPGSDSPTEERPVSNVNWAVDNTNASINGNGLATGLVAGAAQISASLDGVDAPDNALLTITAAEIDSIAIDPPTATISLGGTQVFTATATFSDGTTGPVSATWTSSSQGTATVTPGPATSTTATSVAPGTTTITATVGTEQATAQLTVGPFAPLLVSIDVTPNPASAPIGRPTAFTATGQCTTAPFSATTAPCTPTNVVWAVVTPAVAMIGATSGIATGTMVGSTQITATSGTVVGVATFNVTAAVVNTLVVTPATASVALGGSQVFSVTAVFTDGSMGPIVVDWTSSVPGVATVAPANAAATTATSVSLGATNIVATTVNTLGETITGQGTLTVTGIVLTDLLRVETAAGEAQGRTTPGRAVEFVAIGRFSDNTEAVIDDANISWTTSNPAVATVDSLGFAMGVTQGQVEVRAARVDSPTDTAFALLTVTDAVCTTPLLQSEGATVLEFASPLCVGCTVDDEGNIINASTEDFATVTTPVGLLGGTVGVTVAPGASPPYTVPFAAGNNAGFVIGKPAGTLLTAEVLSQVQVSTLRNGVVQESTSSGIVPLRLDLLGLQLTGGFDTALVSIATSVPYDAIQLTVNSGTASALSTVQVFQACATAEPPAPAANLISLSRVENGTDSVSVGATTGAVLFGTYSDGSDAPIPDADIDWTSSNPSVATVDANGVVTGVAPGTATITGTLKPGVSTGVTTRSVSSTVTVVGDLCTVPISASAGATVADSSSPLCLLCSVSNTANIIDDQSTTFGTIRVPLALLNATSSVTVSTNSATPVAAGGSAGFLIARPVGQLLEAEVLSQIQVTTLLGGVIQQTSGPTIPLRADLLGVALTGGSGDRALVSIQPTLPFDGLRLTFVSGLATAGVLENTLQTVNVYQACSSATPPTP